MARVKGFKRVDKGPAKYAVVINAGTDAQEVLSYHAAFTFASQAEWDACEADQPGVDILEVQPDGTLKEVD